jgi:hypothetical protein
MQPGEAWPVVNAYNVIFVSLPISQGCGEAQMR